uniref:Uncharacterized protein n=1 Tax=Parascaris equorum TaxID=6256 RepID=A0A914R855_PAREQ
LAIYFTRCDYRYRTLDCGREVAVQDIGVRYGDCASAAVLFFVDAQSRFRKRCWIFMACGKIVENAWKLRRVGFYYLLRSFRPVVGELANCGELLKGDSWSDPSDPTAVAENELIGAANSIEAAAVKLAQLRPRQVHVSMMKKLENQERMKASYVDMSGILGLGLRQPVSQTYHRCALRRASSFVLDPNDSTIDSCLSVVAGPSISVVVARCLLSRLPAVASTLLPTPIVFLLLVISQCRDIPHAITSLLFSSE